MKKTLASLATLSSLLITPLMSSANTGSTVIAPKPMDAVYAGSSEFHRMDKKFTATLFGGGLSPGYAIASGVSAGLFLNKNQVILLELNSSEGARKTTYATSSGFETTSGQSETRVRQLGAHFKQFLGNSFYIRGGLDYSQVDYEFNYDRAGGSSTDFQSSFSGNAFIGSVVIGNQWQWQNLTIGADWIGAASVLSSKTAKQSLTGNPTSTDRANFEEDKEFYLNDGGAVFLRGYIGASF